jgi:hypothetical protein
VVEAAEYRDGSTTGCRQQIGCFSTYGNREQWQNPTPSNPCSFCLACHWRQLHNSPDRVTGICRISSRQPVHTNLICGAVSHLLVFDGARMRESPFRDTSRHSQCMRAAARYLSDVAENNGIHGQTGNGSTEGSNRCRRHTGRAPYGLRHPGTAGLSPHGGISSTEGDSSW